MGNEKGGAACATPAFRPGIPNPWTRMGRREGEAREYEEWGAPGGAREERGVGSEGMCGGCWVSGDCGGCGTIAVRRLRDHAGMPAGVADGVCWSRKRSLLESRAEGPLESRRRRWGGGGGRRGIAR